MRSGKHFNSASLEADVMRFLAIIAFCLIAILALVRKQPATVQSDNIPARVESVARPILKQTVLEQTVKQAVLQKSVKKQPVILTGTPRRTPRPDQPIKTQTAQEPLSLQFQSDETFIYLLNTGQLRLYLKNASGISLLDKDLKTKKLAMSRPLDNLYQLQPASIPVQLLNKLKLPADTRYLVALPVRTRRELARLLSDIDIETATGSLVILRNGDVRHDT